MKVGFDNIGIRETNIFKVKFTLLWTLGLLVFNILFYFQQPPFQSFTTQNSNPVWNPWSGKHRSWGQENSDLWSAPLPGELKVWLQQGGLHRGDNTVPAEHHAMVCSNSAQWQTALSQALWDPSHWWAGFDLECVPYFWIVQIFQMIYFNMESERFHLFTGYGHIAGYENVRARASFGAGVTLKDCWWLYFWIFWRF